MKRNVPGVFALMPKAMDGLSVNTPKAVVSACSVIQCCAKICNDPSLSGTQIKIDEQNVKDCMSRLAGWLKQAEEKGFAFYSESSGGSEECETSSNEVKSIALAMAALFSIEEHAAACKTELTKTGTLAVALNIMKTEQCG